MVDPKHIVLGEIQNVMASMRLNRKWSSAAKQPVCSLQCLPPLLIYL